MNFTFPQKATNVLSRDKRLLASSELSFMVGLVST